MSADQRIPKPPNGVGLNPFKREMSLRVIGFAADQSAYPLWSG